MDDHARTPHGMPPPFPPGLTADTLTGALRRTIDDHPDGLALRSHDGRVELTWRTYGLRVAAIAAGLAALGVRAGDTVGLLLTNRPEWQLVDAAALTLGAIPFSLYITSSPEGLRQIQGNARARVLVTDATRAEAVLRADLPGLEHVVVVDDEAIDGTVRLAEVEALGARHGPPPAHRASTHDVATLIYTSGTTGPPKGVELTHANILFVIRAMHDAVPLVRGRVLSYLPHAHVVDRLAGHWTAIATGSTVTCVEDPAAVLGTLPAVRPSRFNAVPRLWEKLQAGILADTAARPPAEAAAFDAALAVGRRRARLLARGEPVPSDLKESWGSADRTVLGPLRRRLGLDASAWTITGSAPLHGDAHEFFAAIGLPLCDIWGMSETVAIGTIATPVDRRAGTVGRAVPDTELRLADDGEVQLRGPHVMPGYRDDPTRTHEAIDPDGWLSTGDVGRLDADGFLTIVDRKKELIVGSSGKNMSPANIEAALKSASPLIGQACCVGDARPYNVALLVLDPAGVAAWARSSAADATTAPHEHPELRAAVARAVEAANARLSRPEQIKRYALLADEWPADGDELTATMKLRRRAIEAKYARTIAELYAGTPAGGEARDPHRRVVAG